MPTILEEICRHKQQDLEIAKQQCPPQELYRKVEALMQDAETSNYYDGGNKHDKYCTRSLSKAIIDTPHAIIAEFKRKSPSLGWIKEDGQADIIPSAYQRAGAAAVSILTDTPYFGGCNDFVRIARKTIDIPILRKDFIIDEYQLFEAREINADAILLIAACLSKSQCASLAHTARQLGLETLLEIHGVEELDYISQDINIVGVNNRNLHTFQTDIQTSLQLAKYIPDEFVKISESGLSTIEHIKMLQQVGYQGFLMGERFMQAPDPSVALHDFIKALNS